MAEEVPAQVAALENQLVGAIYRVSEIVALRGRLTTAGRITLLTGLNQVTAELVALLGNAGEILVHKPCLVHTDALIAGPVARTFLAMD